MEEDAKQPIWFNRPPHFQNLRIQPGLRHPSRLFTKPVPFKRDTDRFPDAQLRLAKNNADAHAQLLILLNDSKNLFSRQLPNMGAGYITRLVFDFNAESVFILHEGVVTGAITSRLFPVEEFIEIVFLAVDSTFQARGYGRLAMSYLKKAILVYPYYDILACADNEAVVYFKKQGFNDKGIFMDPNRWVGRIKDYEGVTLVHCAITQDVDYMNFPSSVSKQIKFIEGMIGKHFLDEPKVLKEAFTAFPEGPTFVSVPLPKIVDMTTNNYPPIEEDLKKVENYDERMKQLREKLTKILNDLKDDPKFMGIFTNPVTEDIAPTYFETIKHPMDFLTIEKRLMRFPDYYKRPEQFAADISLIAENSKSFNQAGTVYVSAANSLINRFKQLYAENFPNNPL